MAKSDSSSTMTHECIVTHGTVSPLTTSFYDFAPLISQFWIRLIKQSTQFSYHHLGECIYNSPIHVDTYPLLGSTHFTMKERHAQYIPFFHPHPLTWFRLYGK